MEQLQSRGKDSSRERYATVFKSASFDALRQKKLLETTADDFFAVFKDGKVSGTAFARQASSRGLGPAGHRGCRRDDILWHEDPQNRVDQQLATRNEHQQQDE